MKHKNLSILALAMSCLVVPRGLAIGQSPTSGAVPTQKGDPAIPESAAGKQLAWFLGVLSAGSSRDEVGAHMAESFKQFIEPGRLATQLEYVGTTILGGGPAVIDRLDPEPSPNRVSGLIRSEANGVVMSFWITVEEETGLIDGLSNQVLHGAGATAPKTWEELDARLEKLPGEVYVYAAALADDGTLRPVHVRNGGARLGTGSTFKLYVLGALTEMVMEGRASWEQPLAIRDEWKSLPSGEMHLLPAGTERPLSEYALKMISISDNTATDHLVMFVGRERVEAYMSRLHGEPTLNIPFLTTRELFTMKLALDRTMAERYIAADVPTRRAMLAPDGDVGKTAPNMLAAAFWKKPVWIDSIEWFCTGEECARAMVEADRLAALPGNEPAMRALRTNPGIGMDRMVWKKPAFKGGSEVGVINLTWLLDRKDGRRFVLSFGWNDPKSPVSDQESVEFAGAAVGILGRN